MASTSKCPYCGGTMNSEEKYCTHCGAVNKNYVEDTPRQIFQPKTIDELKEYCAERGMPLLRMRFFIGEDFKEPRAFGIYQDGDRFVVYKNKDNSTRAIRYQGPDEAYAVNELFQKLLSECHNRGIYPDGKPHKMTYTKDELYGTDRNRDMSSYDPQIHTNRYYDPHKKTKLGSVLKTCGIVLLALLIGLFLYITLTAHKNDGYYRFNNDSDTYWYLYGDKWYYTTSGSDSDKWYPGDPNVDDYIDYREDSDFDSDWGITDFKDSDTYSDLRSSSNDSDSSSSYDSGSSGYDSWDSGGTDWSSDW